MYGPSVMGAVDYEIQQRHQAVAGSAYGSKVIGDTPTVAQVTAQVVKEHVARPTFSLDEIADFLQKQPSLLDDLVLSEMDRPEGPRVPAVTLFIEAAELSGRDGDYVKGLSALLPKPVETDL